MPSSVAGTSVKLTHRETDLQKETGNCWVHAWSRGCFSWSRALSLERNVNPTACSVLVFSFQFQRAQSHWAWLGFNVQNHVCAVGLTLESCFHIQLLMEGSFFVQTRVSHVNVRWFCAVTTSFETQLGHKNDAETWSLQQFSCIFPQVVRANIQYLLIPIPY